MDMINKPTIEHIILEALKNQEGIKSHIDMNDSWFMVRLTIDNEDFSNFYRRDLNIKEVKSDLLQWINFAIEFSNKIV